MDRSPGLGVSLVASGLGQLVSALLTLLVVPLYLRLLGPEAFALIGLLSSLTALAAVLDGGLTVTALREVARGLQARPPADVRRILTTLQAVYAGVAVLIAVGGTAVAIRFGAAWLRNETLDDGTVTTALAVFAVTIALRWPVSLYAGTLRGAERHVPLNVLIATAAIVKHAGGAVVVAVVRTIDALVLWQLVAGAIELAMMAAAAWRAMPPGSSRFDRRVLTETWRFTTAVGATAVFAAVLKQLDRLVLGTLRPLADLGTYAAASALPNGFALVTAPVSQAAMPRLSTLAARRDDAEAGAVFHTLAQIVAFAVAPGAALLAWFPEPFLVVWTGSPAMARDGALTLTLLSVALLLNATLQVPYCMQLAYGLSWIGTVTTGAGLVVVTPLMLFLVGRYGMAGGASAWLILNVGCFAAVPWLLARHVPAAGARRFYLVDTLPFASGAMGACGLVWIMARWLPTAAWLAGAVALALGYVAVSLMCYSALRNLGLRARSFLLPSVAA
jgi:O-antigen/teichoic acid export membrane protein